MKKILSEKDVDAIKWSLWNGIDRNDICILFDCSHATLTRFINNYFRDESPPGEYKSWLDDKYRIYRDGKLWSKHLYGWLTPYIDTDGYSTFGGGLGETKLHRLILKAFVGYPKDGEVARHLDGDVSNNTLDNLQWSTQQQNQFDRIKMGRHWNFPNYNKSPQFFCTKKYGHNIGLSACFRQWRAKSHCSFAHGYPLAFEFTFGCTELDSNGWVMDYGSLKPIKKWLEQHFDHKWLVAYDDPQASRILELEDFNIAEVILVEATGCEAFAKMAYFAVEKWLTGSGNSPRVWLQKVTVSEHDSNSATYEPWSYR